MRRLFLTYLQSLKVRGIVIEKIQQQQNTTHYHDQPLKTTDNNNLIQQL